MYVVQCDCVCSESQYDCVWEIHTHLLPIHTIAGRQERGRKGDRGVYVCVANLGQCRQWLKGRAIETCAA